MHKTKMMKKLFMTALMVAASIGLTNAQTVQKQIVEEGGTGPFKSEVVGDASWWQQPLVHTMRQM